MAEDYKYPNLKRLVGNIEKRRYLPSKVGLNPLPLIPSKIDLTKEMRDHGEPLEMDWNALPAYSGHIAQGYHWMTNTTIDELPQSLRKYTSEGLDILVDSRAFNALGSPSPTRCAVFVREKPVKKE
ncbi:MAG TPA: hypothetical protein VJK51_04240 [Candidatus Nanoarchaeia archaeon]|nr:hypothetical protein [Candidatus Nanoarchaeia archaeon]